MTSAKAAALRPAEHFTWRSLAGLAAILAVATAFGVLLVLVRWRWPPLGRLDRTLVISLNRLGAGHVIGGWLLGTAWLGVTTHAFGRWQAETGQRPAHVSGGLAPEAAPQLRLAQARPVAHPWRIAARLAAAFVLIGGALYGAGRLAVSHPPAFEDSIPRWLAGHRAPGLDAVSYWCSQAGSARWTLALTLLIAPLAAAARPASPAPPDSRPVIPATHRPIPLSTFAVRDRKERTCT